MHTKQVLMISYFFPPSPSVGALRPARFFEYLPDFGWQPHVLTIIPAADLPTSDPPHIVRTHYISPWKWREQRSPSNSNDAAPWSLRQAAQRTSVRQTLYFLLRHVLPMSSVRMPDATLGWYPFAVQAGCKLIQHHKFDLIWSTAGPPTTHLIAARLCRLTGLPWIADFRDPWALNFQERRLPWFQNVEEWLEQWVLKPANRVTTVSEGFKAVLSRLHHQPIDVIYNGYEASIDNNPVALDTRFSLRYTGSLYPEMRDMRPFLQALAQARAAEPSFQPCVEFIGPELNWFAELASSYGLDDIVTCFKPVSRSTALDLQRRATGLLLFDWSADDKPGWLPVKMFEYMQTGRPILEIGSQQRESAATIARCRAGVTVEQPDDIQAVLRHWWHEFQQTGTVASTTDKNQVSQYTRRRQTERLAEVFNALYAQ